jgi:hypothetical protein
MAEALNITENVWSGTAAEYFLLRPVTTMDTYEKGCISLINGIKKIHTIDRIEVSNFIQDAAATPISQGSILVDYKQIIPNRFDLYMEFNPHDFEQTVFSPELQKFLLDRALPVTANNFVLLQLMRRVNQYYEYATWQSRLAYNPTTGTQTCPAALQAITKENNFYYFDGLIEKLLLDANTLLVPGAVTLTYSNIRSQMDACIALVPLANIAKYGADGLKILVSINTWLLYGKALREDAFKNQNTTDKNPDEFQGYDIVRCSGIPDNTIIMCIANPNPQSSELMIGVNEFGDKDNLKMGPILPFSDLWAIRAEQKVDVQIGFTDQVVLYTTLTA